MTKYKRLVAAGLTMFSAVALAACSNSNNSDVKSGYKPSVKMAEIYQNPNKSSSTYNDGTLKVAEFSSSPFAGMSTASLQSKSDDIDVYSPGSVSLFKTNAKDEIVDGGLANLRLDKKAKVATITLRPDAKWSNGDKVVAKDVEYSYEIIASPESTSQHYSDNWGAIKGMKEFHTGKAKTISGITMPKGPNGRVVEIHYTKFAPALKFGGNSFMWSSLDPSKYFKDIPIAKLGASDQVRKHPIFIGPYKLAKQVTGESTSWVPNKYYYGKKPQIKHITIQVVSPNNFTSSLRAKQYDFSISGGVSSEYPQIKKLKDYQVVGTLGTSFNYLAFNLGHYDTKKQENVSDKNAKMANPNLRKAMMYALDIGALRKKFNNGLAWQPNSLISPYYKQYHNDKSPRYTYNLKKANELLDKAGYKKKGKWRVQPNGKPLKINFGAMTGTPASEAQENYYLQQWRKVGLDANFTGGRPMESNKFYANLTKPKQNTMDVFEGGFGVASEPTPTGIFGRGAAFNIGHFVSAKNDQLLNNMNNDKSWNDKYRQKQFKDWQTYMQEQAAYVPTSMSISWTPVNTRVKGYDARPSATEFWSSLSLTNSKPE